MSTQRRWLGSGRQEKIDKVKTSLAAELGMTDYYLYDHTHCWNQGDSPACGLPKDTHTICCLCAKPRTP